MGESKNLQVNKAVVWLRKQPTKVKYLLAAGSTILALLILKLLIRKQDDFFIAAEFVHFVGLLVLIYKLTTQRSCSGLSLKYQEITATFLCARLICSFVMEGDIHTILDLVTLTATIWVIYMMRTKLKSSYVAEQDNMPRYYVVLPCAILALKFQPYTPHHFVFNGLWAFCVYLESVSVLPQIRMIHNSKYIEPFTAHYVFALGVARFLSFAHWIITIYDTNGLALLLMADVYLWRPLVFIAEVIQTFILADFCYYYVKSLMSGRVLTNLPV